MEGIFRVLSAALRVASRPFALALDRMNRLLAFVRDFIIDFAGDISWTRMLIISMVAAGLALGVGSAVVFIRGDDNSPLATAPTQTIAASVTHEPATGAPTPTIAAARTAEPANIMTLRGEIDVSSMTAAGLLLPQHSVEFVIFKDTGAVTGSMVIGVDGFPIGMILAGTFGGTDDPAWSQFKDCTVRLTLDGVVTGTYDGTTGALRGETLVTPVREDVNHCLDTRPPNVSVDSTIETSTFTWTASFDGSTLTGTANLDPPSPFAANVVD